MVVWIVGIMFYLNAGLALVSLALIPPMALAINFFRVKARQNYRQIRERIAQGQRLSRRSDLRHGDDPVVFPREQNLP